MTLNSLEGYNYTGIFQLKSENTILGEIKYIKNFSNNYKLYRVADFIRILHLPRNFTNFINCRYRFPEARHCWAPWISIKSALTKYSHVSKDIENIAKRKSPEINPPVAKSLKNNEVCDFIQELPYEKQITALNTYNNVLSNFEEWIRNLNGKVEDYSLKDFEELSAMDFVNLLHSCKLKIVSEARNNKSIPTELQVNNIDNKNLQVVLNIQLP